MCIEIAFDFTFGYIDLLQTIFPVSVSITRKCASLVITKTSPFPELSGISDTDSCGMFKLEMSENITFRETTAEDVSDSALVRNRIDDVMVSSMATCKVD